MRYRYEIEFKDETSAKVCRNAMAIVNMQREEDVFDAATLSAAAEQDPFRTHGTVTTILSVTADSNDLDYLLDHNHRRAAITAITKSAAS